MTTFQIRYRYNEALSRSIYIERAERRTETTIEVRDAQLSPEARQHALDAMVA